MSRRYLVLHSVMKMVKAAGRRGLFWQAPAALQPGTTPLHPDPPLTQVEAHTHEDDEAKPGTEDRGEVNDADDNVCNGGDDAEDNVAVGREGGWRISLAQWGCPATPQPLWARSDLSRLLMLLVPRSTLRRTSPVRRPRCQRRDSPCRWAKSCTCTCRLVNCCTHTHRKVRKLLTKPVEPAGHRRTVSRDWRHGGMQLAQKAQLGKRDLGWDPLLSPNWTSPGCCSQETAAVMGT